MNNIRSAPLLNDVEDGQKSCTGEVRRFYAGKNILLTGYTGLLGSLFLEKVIRSCAEISKIYIIVRLKKGVSPEERMRKRFENNVFDEMRKVRPNFMEKVVLIQGDLCKEDLGLSPEDRQRIIENVNIIIHNGALVHFVMKPSILLRTNVIATRKMLELAAECSRMEIFVYVSTAYSHLYNQIIEEKVYPAPGDMKFVEDIIRADEENQDGLKMDALTEIMAPYPNLYLFSKAIAEGVVEDFSRKASFPCAIFRPSVVVPPYVEPTQSWIGNMNGGIQPALGFILGLVHALHMDRDVVLDMIPGDMTINYLLTLIYDRVTHRKANKIECYNYGSSDWNPCTYGEGEIFLRKAMEIYKFRKAVWHPFLLMLNNFYVFFIVHVLLHVVPAAIADLIFVAHGKKAIILSRVWKVTKSLRVLDRFQNASWLIKADKAKDIKNRISPADLQEFNFDLSILDWERLMVVSLRGVKVFFKEPVENDPVALKKSRRLMILHYTVCTILAVVTLFFFYKIVCCVCPL